jgi:hypothetical protein
MVAVASILAAVCLTITGAPAHDGPVETSPADDRDFLITLGARVHGGFGSLIAAGIRIGDDARRRLDAAPRDLDVTYFSSPGAPCPCVVDGVMVATRASPGQSTLRVASEPADVGLFGRVLIRHKRSGRAFEYDIPDAVWPRLRDINLDKSSVARWNAVMAIPEDQLFSRRAAPGDRRPAIEKPAPAEKTP